ncbi:LysR substrate-binding domain-containing protein [Sulfitobacter pacificus]|uniref:LysR family transcriptional regulator n=1 Tax=Sulfitobacter pacificus TaxID=1499314 RepID=A0ABQ5VPE3_9RHOB|nr:LysR substrate-binding domain-containing protein [Sulfitobacter pacificus]GLQ28924.1 LysR family transcriptional regulator [Sulfitobacter pacificus]
MKTPPLTSLRAFEATARHLSFSEAGDELFVTHAAISHHVRRLEEWFESELFIRKGRSIALTRSGETLFRHLSPALAEIAETCTRVKALGGKQALTVGCIPSIASRWLVPNLQLFTAENPEVDLRVLYASENQKFSQSGIDVLITLGKEDADGVVSEQLFSRLTKPVCSPKFLAEHGPFDTPDAFISVPLLHDESRKGWRDWFAAAHAPWTGGDNWPVYQDFNLLFTAAIAGHGIALCPVDTFRNEIEAGDLIVLSDIATNTESYYFGTYSKNTPRAALNFVEWFVALANWTKTK